eukprot:10997774-Alexandrium_andersonii.AAC.1
MASTSLAKLFGAAKNRWGVMPSEDRHHVMKAIDHLGACHTNAVLERAKAAGPARAGADAAEVTPAAAAVERQIENIQNVLQRAREEIQKDRQGNVLLAAHDCAREYITFTGKSSQETGANWEDYLAS